MRILGLTGSIGSGKSTTSAMFRAFGCPVHDADGTVHALYRGRAAPLIADAFPGTVKDGVVDRRALSSALNGDQQRFKRLEAIVHPLVREEEEQAITAARLSGQKLLILDIPLLFETGGEKRCDAVIVTHVDPAEQRRRVLARPGMTEALFETLLARQMPAAQKCARAHAVINTGHGLAAAKGAVQALIRAFS